MDDDKIRAIMAPVVGNPEMHGGLIIQINGTRGETTVEIVVQKHHKINHRHKNRAILELSDVPYNLPYCHHHHEHILPDQLCITHSTRTR